jgi:cystathionine beta-lyase
MDFDFDRDIGRRGTNCTKWDSLEKFTGVNPDDGLAMWVADSDFTTAPCVIDAIRKRVEHGAFGYGYDDAGLRAAIGWWMKTRHDWDIQPEWIIPTQGLGHAIGMAFDTWTEIGDGICYFTPVYHEFKNKTERAERVPYPLPMKLVDGRYELDFDTAEEMLDDTVKMLIFCSPQNPSGRVWTAEELRAVAAFCEKHDLILLSDEIHADLMYNGVKHTPTDKAAPEFRHRIVTINASSKTFNLPGFRLGYAIIPDEALRAAYQRRMTMTEYSPATLAVAATIAAYTQEGAAWVDAQLKYLEGNRAVFDEGVNAIPGVHSMPLESTYLAWVDFSGTGMDNDEVTRRVRDDAKIGASQGETFGPGGETFKRFNLAMPRFMIEDAVARLQKAFADLQ